MAKVRGMAAEFRASFDELARQSELDALRREVEALRLARPADFGLREPLAEADADIRSALAPPAPPAAQTETKEEPEPKAAAS
jgi:sec-independent protein translocase protein TatB